MELNIDNNRLRKLIPNIIHEVEGETPLVDKMQPWLDSARIWLEDYFLGPELELSDCPSPSLVEKIVVYSAFADAIPSLDVTLSPAGFAVINTDGRAPASKERVERLVASLQSFVDSNLRVLVSGLAAVGKWRNSEVGCWWLSTFNPDLENALHLRLQGEALFTAYRRMRLVAERFEAEAADLYLGRNFLDMLRRSYPAFDADGASEVYNQIRIAEMAYVRSHIGDTQLRCPDEHEIWHLVSPVLAALEYWPALKRQWENEMGEAIRVQPFKNNVTGGYFF